MRALLKAFAGGREVCFVATLNAEGVAQTARVVARGDVSSVLALPGFANRGEMLVHNHPSGLLEPSDADLVVAAKMHDDGIGFAITDNEASRLYTRCFRSFGSTWAATALVPRPSPSPISASSR